MKKLEERVEEGLHPIENENRPHAVRKKKGGIRLKSKYHRRITKVLASFSAAAVLCLGVFGVNALFFRTDGPNVVDEGFVTVAYELPTDGSTPDMHSALENIGYMNTRLMGQENYYTEMHGNVNTMIQQQVSTYKQYDDSVLIQTDITTSSMVNSARQFCYVGDRVIWRDAAGGPSTYDGVNTAWKDGDPYGNMLVEDFQKANGLPGTAFSVYVINEETLLGADPVVVNEDGTYSQTYYLDPATDKAPAYYVNQMMFTGGLTALPTFEYITVTYTFDDTWQVLQSVIDEKYTATMGVSVGCTALYTTNYEYDTEKAVSDAYDAYFKNYADKPTTTPDSGNTVTAAACLSNAFAPVLSGPVTFSLDLTVDGAPFSGLVYVDASDMENLQLRAQLGNIFVEYAGDEIRLAYGSGVKGKASVEEIMALIASFLPADGEGGLSLDTDALLSQLGGGEFAVSEDGSSATLDSELSLFGLTVPVHFSFEIAEDGTISLGYISTELSLGSVPLSARLAYSDETVPEAEGEYVDLIPYVEDVLGLVNSDVLAVEIDYAADGFSVGGTMSLNISDLSSITANGKLDLTVGEAKKEIAIAYAGGYAYVDLDGLKIKANVEDAVALVMQFIGGEISAPDLGDFDLGGLLTTILSEDFAKNIALSEKENALEVALGMNELLSALGADLGGIALGDVQLSISDGTLAVEALGAQLFVRKGENFAVETEGYTDILPLVNELAALFTNENLKADVSYSAGDLTVGGTVRLNLDSLAAAGELTLGYRGAEKQIGIIYAGDALALDLDGIKVKANVNDAVSLISALLGAEGGLSVDESALLHTVLSMNFGEVLSLESETSVVIKGSELLKALGVDVDLGDIALTAEDGTLTADVLGASVAVSAADAFDATIGEEYTDILPYAEALIGFLKDTQYLHADVEYTAENLSVAGTLELSLADLAVQGNVEVTYNGAAISVGFIYAEEVIYLNVNGLKVKANVNEAISLITGLLGINTDNLTSSELDILETVFALDLGELVTFDDTDALTLTLKGTELLKALGVDFALGDVNVTVASDKITASVLGADLALTKGEAFTVDTEGYTDILPYAEALIGFLKDTQYLHADVEYTAENLSVAGTLELSLADLAVQGNVEVTYNGAAISVGFIYAEEVIYLNVNGLKVKANVNEAISLITGLLGINTDNLTSSELDILETVFALDLGELVKFDDTDALTLTLKGTELLKALGVDFALGDVNLSVASDKITASVLGADLALTKGEAFTVDTEGYTDILPYAEALIGFLKDTQYLHADVEYTAENLSVAGTLELSLADLAVQGNVEVTYNGAAISVGFIYAEEVIYLNVNGLKVKANVNEAISLITGLLGINTDNLTSSELDILETVFALDLGELVKFDDTDALTLTLKGTELLKALGVDFVLGDVNLSVASDKITASALGADLALTKGEVFTVETEGYTDILPYAEALIGFLKDTQYLHADVEYTAENLSVAGTLELSLADLAVQGNVEVTYNGAAISVGFIYAEEVIYLNVNGLKVKANVNEAISLITGLLGINTDNLTSSELDILETVFALDLGELVKFDDTDALTLTLKGTELLKALGVDFALGDVNLSVASDKITASVLGADLALTKGEAFTADTEGYTDILPLVNAVIDLVRENGLKVSVGYTKGDLSLAGTLSVSLKEFAVKGELTVSYQTAGKTVGFAYGADGYIYLTIEGAKLKLSVKDAIGAVTQIVDAETGEPDLNAILSKLFALNLGEVIDLTSESSLLLRGTQLLRALGVQFDLGDLSLERNENGSISVAAEENSALNGLALTLTKGAAFAIDGDDYADYADVTPVLDTVIEIIKNESLSIGGTLALTYQNTRITLSVQNGAIAWGGDGFMLTLDLILTLDDVSQKIEVYADAERVKLVYGSVGVDLEYTESALRGLSDAFRSVYERIMTTAQGYVVGETLPTDFDALTSSMQTGAAITEIFAKLDLPALINAISFGAPTEGGIVSVSYGDISAELKVGKDGSLTIAVLPFSTGDLTASGTLTAGTFAGTIAEPEGEYLTGDDIAELLDFIGAAFGTLTARDVRWTIGENAKTVYTSEGTTKFNIKGELVYHAGGDTLFTIDTENKTLVADPDSYVYVKLWLDEVAAEGTDLYFEFWMFDYDGNEELDFFVSLSKYRPEDTENYAPLNFAVSASDLLTLASSGVSLLQDTLQSFLAQLGITETDAVFGILNDYLISKWLTPDEQGQFGAVGSVLMNTLGINEAIKGMLDGVTEAVTGETVLADIPFDYYLTELGVTYDEAAGTTSFTVALDSNLVYGGEGLSPLTVTLTKSGEQGSSLLTGMALENIYGENNSERTSVSFAVSYEPLTLANADGSAVLTSGAGESAEKVASLTYSEYANYMFDGVDELLKSIALSATHKDGDSYKLNDSFYISGSASGSIIGIQLTDLPIAVGVTVNDGDVVVNLSVSYDNSLAGAVAFNSSGTTEMTIDVSEEMVYMRRTIEGEAAEYRIMPLSNFMNDILNQVNYIFNFTDIIANQIAGASSDSDSTSGSDSDSDSDSDSGSDSMTDTDYGTLLSNYLTRYQYNSGTDGNTWLLVLNGGNFTNDVMSDINVTLSSTAENILSGITLDTSIAGLLSLNAELVFRNPCGEWQDGYSDTTTRLDTLFASADRLSSFNWKTHENDYYIVPEIISVTYYADGIAVDTQDIWYDSGSGTPLCSMLYPQISSDTLVTAEADGYVFMGWWYNDNGTWKQYTQDLLSSDYIAEALWLKSETGSMSGQRWYYGWQNGFKDGHSINVAMNTFFIASFADQLQLRSTSYIYLINNVSDEIADTTYGTISTDASITLINKTKDYAHTTVTQTFDLCGSTITIVSVGHGEYSYSGWDAATLMSASLTVHSVTCN